MTDAQRTTSTYPGESLGLPESGPGSAARWGQRIAALVIDWAGSMLIAQGIGLVSGLRGDTQQAALTMIVFFIARTLLTWLVGSSFGQAVTGVRIVRSTGGRLGLGRSALRTALVCLVLPAVVIGPDRRALDDLLIDSVAISTR